MFDDPGFEPMVDVQGDPLAAMLDEEGGRCRNCSCTDLDACILSGAEPNIETCAWADSGQTLCSNPDCVAS